MNLRYVMFCFVMIHMMKDIIFSREELNYDKLILEG